MTGLQDKTPMLNKKEKQKKKRLILNCTILAHLDCALWLPVQYISHISFADVLRFDLPRCTSQNLFRKGIRSIRNFWRPW